MVRRVRIGSTLVSQLVSWCVSLCVPLRPCDLSVTHTFSLCRQSAASHIICSRSCFALGQLCTGAPIFLHRSSESSPSQKVSVIVVLPPSSPRRRVKDRSCLALGRLAPSMSDR